MSGLTGGAAEHAGWVIEILLATVAVLAALIAGLWRGFRWLDERIGERIGKWADSKDFKSAVAEIVTQAAAGWNDINNRLHEEHRRGIAELRRRDEERLDSVKRAHQRIDGMMAKGGKE